jgi:DNA modification methylase
MNIQEIDINEVLFAPYNPRVMTNEVLEKLKKSIQEYGVYSPLIVNKATRHVVGGNQRLAALRVLGHKTIHVVMVDLSLEKEKVLNIQLNKISGEWDFEKLSQLLDELSKMPEIEVAETGFELPEISQIFDDYGRIKEEDGFDFDAAVNAIEEPVTRIGDIVSIGEHLVMCADATDPQNLEQLFGDERAAMYFSDWPYGIAYDPTSRPGAKASKWKPIKNDDLGPAEHVEWMRKVVSATVLYLKPGAPVYLWNGHAQFWDMSHLCIEAGIHPSCVITWEKPGFAPSFADYQQQTEFLLYGWKEGAAHPWFGKAESSLWKMNRDPVNSLIHSTQKPVGLSQRAIRNSSLRGDLVFDSCLGSGSTLIGAESLGRRCFGLEIEPVYCDAIIRRFIAFAGVDKVSHDVRNRYLKEAGNECK